MCHKGFKTPRLSYFSVKNSAPGCQALRTVPLQGTPCFSLSPLPPFCFYAHLTSADPTIFPKADSLSFWTLAGEEKNESRKKS